MRIPSKRLTRIPWGFIKYSTLIQYAWGRTQNSHFNHHPRCPIKWGKTYSKASQTSGALELLGDLIIQILNQNVCEKGGQAEILHSLEIPKLCL